MEGNTSVATKRGLQNGRDVLARKKHCNEKSAQSHQPPSCAFEFSEKGTVQNVDPKYRALKALLAEERSFHHDQQSPNSCLSCGSRDGSLEELARPSFTREGLAVRSLFVEALLEVRLKVSLNLLYEVVSFIPNLSDS